LINIPIGLLVILLASQVVPATRAAHPAGIDLAGTLLFAGTLVALLVPLTMGQKLGWPTWTWVMLVLAVVLAIVTFRVESGIEKRGEVPLLPPSVLRLRSMWRGLAMLLPYSMGFGAFMFVFALTVQDGLGFSALRSGLAILPMVILFFIGSMVSPRLISRYGRGAMAGGAGVQAIGLALIIAVIWRGWPHVSMFDLAGPLALIGGGQSLLFVGLFRVVLTDVPAHHGGIGGGVLVTLQQTGLALGVATLGTLYVALAPLSFSHAFAAAIGAQLAITVLLMLGSSGLPPFTTAQANEVVAEV
jgi:hypothetical protein